MRKLSVLLKITDAYNCFAHYLPPLPRPHPSSPPPPPSNHHRQHHHRHYHYRHHHHQQQTNSKIYFVSGVESTHFLSFRWSLHDGSFGLKKVTRSHTAHYYYYYYYFPIQNFRNKWSHILINHLRMF